MAAIPAIPGLSGLSGLPPLNLGSSATSALNTSGSLFHASGDGDWTNNFGGSGLLGGFGGFGASSSGGATAGGPSWLLLAALAGAAWLIFKR